jgi:hypothetical protein
MSDERRRWLIFGVLVAALALGAVAVVLLSGDESAAPPARDAVKARSRGDAESIDPVARQLARDVAEHEEREQAEGKEHEDGPVTEAQQALEAEARDELAPLAERFFAAFSRYEIGELDEGVEAELRATATPGYARELLAAPPRPPISGEVPERAELSGELVLVPLEADGGEFSRVELVGEIARGGENPHAIAFELSRAARGWRVSGLGE